MCYLCRGMAVYCHAGIWLMPFSIVCPFKQKGMTMESHLQTIKTILKGYFNVLPDKENESEIIASISKGVSFYGANLWVLIFAIFIASLGLNVNSTAVIIGAMLISPLMGPIIGMGLAIGINDIELLRRAMKNYLVATVISVITATFYFLITPLDEAQSELLARTSPTLYDVLIAFFGGMAGIVAICTKGKGNVIPGVAIATALMPPLCTAGYGLAMGNLYYFFGAFYLFFINTVFICLATFVGVRMLKFSEVKYERQENFKKVRKIIVGIVLVTMLPATFLTVNIIKESLFNSALNKFVKQEMSFPGTQIISTTADKNTKTIRLVAVGKEITDHDMNVARNRMTQYGLKAYELNVIQGTQSDSLLRLGKQLASKVQKDEGYADRILEQSKAIYRLEQQLDGFERYLTLSGDVRDELKVLFPAVESVALAKTSEAKVDTAVSIQRVVAIVSLRRNTPAKSFDKARFSKWVSARVKTDSVKVIVE